MATNNRRFSHISLTVVFRSALHCGSVVSLIFKTAGLNEDSEQTGKKCRCYILVIVYLHLIVAISHDQL
jgi:hypothetical protein